MSEVRVRAIHDHDGNLAIVRMHATYMVLKQRCHFIYDVGFRLVWVPILPQIVADRDAFLIPQCCSRMLIIVNKILSITFS